MVIVTTYSGSAHCDKLLDDRPSEFALPDEVADDLIATAFVYLAAWHEVFEHYKTGDHPLFGLTGKAHIMLHACILSRSGHCHTRKYDKGHVFSSLGLHI